MQQTARRNGVEANRATINKDVSHHLPMVGVLSIGCSHKFLTPADQIIKITTTTTTTPSIMTCSIRNDDDNATTTTKIAFSVMLLNAGETTRAVEIAKAMVRRSEEASDDASGAAATLDVKFFSTFYAAESEGAGGYERFVTDAGFDVVRVGPGLTRQQWQTLMDREHSNLQFYTPEEKEQLIETLVANKDAIARYDPDLIVNGFTFNCDAPMASQLLGIPNVAFLPLPCSPQFLYDNLVADLPDFVKEKGPWVLPKFMRKALAVFLARSFDSQSVLNEALTELGFVSDKKGLSMLDFDYSVVNDLPGNYRDVVLPSNVEITGPVFPFNDNDDKFKKQQLPDDLDPEIVRVFAPENPNKVFVAMGSSGHKEHLLEAVKAIADPPKGVDKYHAVVLAPPSMCSLEELREVFPNKQVPSNIYLTDQFQPAKVVNGLADFAIIHGGQGTVQTAMGCGTPVISVPFQPEQEWNLKCVEERGAGIMLHPSRWTAANISKSLERLVRDNSNSYKTSARAVEKEMELIDGSANTARSILEFARKHQHRQQAMLQQQ